MPDPEATGPKTQKLTQRKVEVSWGARNPKAKVQNLAGYIESGSEIGPNGLIFELPSPR